MLTPEFIAYAERQLQNAPGGGIGRWQGRNDPFMARMADYCKDWGPPEHCRPQDFMPPEECDLVRGTFLLFVLESDGCCI